MSEELHDGVVNGVVTSVLLLSAASWIYIVSAWRRGSILTYESRRPVPWGPAAGAMAVLFAVRPLLSSLDGPSAHDADANLHAIESIEFLLRVIASQGLIVGSFALIVLALSGASARDLGLPENKRQLARDTFIGVVACAAAIVPVFAINAILNLLLHRSSSGHELVQMLSNKESSPLVWILGALTAVVIAPVCEEVIFRLLLQGGLESWEFRRANRPESAAEIALADAALPVEQSATEVVMPEAVAADRQPDTATSLQCEPPARGMAGQPPGWFPIVASSLLFALAHFGYGPEPVPLFFLALVLGYIYQRTHRILPSIVAHALFNSFTMIILWRMSYHAK